MKKAMPEGGGGGVSEGRRELKGGGGGGGEGGGTVVFVFVDAAPPHLPLDRIRIAALSKRRRKLRQLRQRPHERIQRHARMRLLVLCNVRAAAAVLFVDTRSVKRSHLSHKPCDYRAVRHAGRGVTLRGNLPRKKSHRFLVAKHNVWVVVITCH